MLSRKLAKERFCPLMVDYRSQVVAEGIRAASFLTDEQKEVVLNAGLCAAENCPKWIDYSMVHTKEVFTCRPEHERFYTNKKKCSKGIELGVGGIECIKCEERYGYCGG